MSLISGLVSAIQRIATEFGSVANLINQKVDKVNNKSLLLNSEITRLDTLDIPFKEYASESAIFNDQSNQKVSHSCYNKDTENLYIYLGTTNGDEDDYHIIYSGRLVKSIPDSSYTLEIKDKNRYLEFSNQCVVTVPLGLPANLDFQGEAISTKPVTFVAAQNGTLNYPSQCENMIGGQYGTFGIRTKEDNVSTLLGFLKLS